MGSGNVMNKAHSVTAQILVAAILSLFPFTASADNQYVAVDVRCCGAMSPVKIPAKGMRGLGGKQIGLTSVSCKQFFEGTTVQYAGWPQQTLGRNINLGSVDASAVRQDICKQLRDKGTVCCDMLSLCDDSCKDMPGPRAAVLFEGIYEGLTSDSTLTPANKIAISRFLSNCETKKLLNEITNMPCPEDWGAPAGCKMGEYIDIKLRFRARDPNNPEAGSVWPGQPFPNPDPNVSDPQAVKNFDYIVSVTNQTDGGPGESHHFPSPQNSCFSYTFSDGASAMASTIYHELLHVWWMNKNQTDYNNSGHGTDLHKCGNYQPFFAQKLKDFYRGMDGLEKCIKENPVPNPDR